MGSDQEHKEGKKQKRSEFLGGTTPTCVEGGGGSCEFLRNELIGGSRVCLQGAEKSPALHQRETNEEGHRPKKGGALGKKIAQRPSGRSSEGAEQRFVSSAAA